MRLWKNNPTTPEGKYLVTRRDGTHPTWPFLVIAASDPAAPAAIRAYATTAQTHGYDPEYINDLHNLADEFEQWRTQHGEGDPDAPRHRTDDPHTIDLMRQAKGS